MEPLKLTELKEKEDTGETKINLVPSQNLHLVDSALELMNFSFVKVCSRDSDIVFTENVKNLFDLSR